jgi:hypothetical protein
VTDSLILEVADLKDVLTGIYSEDRQAAAFAHPSGALKPANAICPIRRCPPARTTWT